MIVTAALVATLVAVLVVTHWPTVRDHVEAWHFLATRDTETIAPVIVEGAEDFTYQLEDALTLFHIAANVLRCSVIFDPLEVPSLHRQNRVVRTLSLGGGGSRDEIIWHPQEGVRVLIEKHGWRVLEQRFPRKAYVVIRDSTPPGQIAEAPQRFRGASTTIEVKAAPGTPRSPFSE